VGKSNRVVLARCDAVGESGMIIMSTSVRPPLRYESADRDFFVHHSRTLPDKPEEAFLVRIRRWLELADSALKTNNFPMVDSDI